MKKSFLHFLSLLVTVGLLASCSEIKDSIKKDFDLSNSFSITMTGASNQQINAIVFEEDFNNDEIAEYKERIKDLTLNGITLRVTGFTPIANSSAKPILNGQMEFAVSGSNTFKKISTISNLDLQEQFQNPPATETSLPVEAANQKELVDLIKAGSKVQFRISGTNTAPFQSATIKFTLTSTLTVGL